MGETAKKAVTCHIIGQNIVIRDPLLIQGIWHSACTLETDSDERTVIDRCEELSSDMLLGKSRPRTMQSSYCSKFCTVASYAAFKTCRCLYYTSFLKRCLKMHNSRLTTNPLPCLVNRNSTLRFFHLNNTFIHYKDAPQINQERQSASEGKMKMMRKEKTMMTSFT